MKTSLFEFFEIFDSYDENHCPTNGIHNMFVNFSSISILFSRSKRRLDSSILEINNVNNICVKIAKNAHVEIDVDEELYNGLWYYTFDYPDCNFTIYSHKKIF